MGRIFYSGKSRFHKRREEGGECDEKSFHLCLSLSLNLSPFLSLTLSLSHCRESGISFGDGQTYVVLILTHRKESNPKKYVRCRASNQHDSSQHESCFRSRHARRNRDSCNIARIGGARGFCRFLFF